jgi:hypothetical protein
MLLQVILLFLVIKWIYYVFSKFRESKFALNHLFEIKKKNLTDIYIKIYTVYNHL